MPINNSFSKPALIAIDWGNTRFRCWLLDINGNEIDNIDTEFGISKIKDTTFSQVFENIMGGWFHEHGSLPVIASGMIGSRHGWLETPYIPCPAGPEEFAKHLVYVSLNIENTNIPKKIAIVPGMSYWDEGVPDLMRGEETQVAGFLWDKQQSGWIVLPGTHSKWVLTKAGKIEAFKTFMSGEIFALMVEHSILQKLMEGNQQDENAFKRGCIQSFNSQQGLLNQLFSVRTMGLLNQVEAKGIHSFISGIIIGCEIKEGMSLDAHNFSLDDAEVNLIGEISLCNLYRHAFEIANIKVNLVNNNPVVKGLFHVAGAASLYRTYE